MEVRLGFGMWVWCLGLLSAGMSPFGFNGAVSVSIRCELPRGGYTFLPAVHKKQVTRENSALCAFACHIGRHGTANPEISKVWNEKKGHKLGRQHHSPALHVLVRHHISAGHCSAQIARPSWGPEPKPRTPSMKPQALNFWQSRLQSLGMARGRG